MSFYIMENEQRRLVVPQWVAEYTGLGEKELSPNLPTLYIRDARLMTWEGDTMKLIDDGVLVITDGRISYAGPRKGAPPKGGKDVLVDAEGRLVTPGLMDPHTHLIFGGDRAREFELRLKGASYEEILKSGGGINSTVEATRSAEEEELVTLARERLDEELMRGVTTVEAKTGYFLDEEGELKALKLYTELSHLHPVRIAPTLLAAHVVPREYRERREEYVSLVRDRLVPEMARLMDERTRFPAGEETPYHFHTLAGEPMPHWGVDVFCESSAFTLEETESILSKARDLGLGVKLHAGQFSAMGAAGLGARLGALSVDHMEEYTDDELEALAKSGTVVTFLPGAAYTLRMDPPKMADFRKHGIPVALATDMNPGTSMTTHLPLMMSMGAQLCDMTVEEAWRAVTLNGARALGMSDVLGNLTEGAIGDVVVWHFSEPAELLWRLGEGYPWLVVREGLVVWEN